MADLTIIMPAYNKAKYIAEALDSVFAQRTGYSYEIVVADDCSTDGTLDIVARYEKAHPGVIRVLRSDQNLKLFRNIVRVYADLKTPYFCVLDPDDYWSHPQKVQRALDFLETHRDFTVYAGNSLAVGPWGSRPFVPLDREVDCDFDGYVAGRGVLGQTAGAVYRNVIFARGLPDKLRSALRPDQEMTFRGDAFRNFIHLHEGRVHFDPRCDAVYRITEEGLWQGMSECGRQLRNVLLFLNLDEYFGFRYYGLLYRALSRFSTAVGGTDDDAELRRRLAVRLSEASDGQRRQLSSHPLVSVLMPAFNHERYVEAAVRSVLEQDWPRVELLVVDDGSGDGTWEVLERLRPECESTLERVVIVRQENRGTTVTCNRLFEMSRGEYVLILASDDSLLPGALAALAAPLDGLPEVGVAVGQNELMDDAGNRCFWDDARNVVYDRAVARHETFNDFIRWKRGIEENGPDYGSYAALLKANHIPNGALIRRNLLVQVLPFHKEAPLEDYWLHLQLTKITRYVAVPAHTFRYRWHAVNTIRQESRMGSYFEAVLAWEERRVEQCRNRRWLKAFRREYWDLAHERGFRGVLTVRSYRTKNGRRRLPRCRQILPENTIPNMTTQFISETIETSPVRRAKGAATTQRKLQ